MKRQAKQPVDPRIARLRAVQLARRIACRSCAREFRPAQGHVPPHKCPHGLACRSNQEVMPCHLCAILYEARPEILDPDCVFCNGEEQKAARAKLDPEGRWFRAGCLACSFGSTAGDPELMRAVSEEMGDVFGALR